MPDTIFAGVKIQEGAGVKGYLQVMFPTVVINCEQAHSGEIQDIFFVRPQNSTGEAYVFTACLDSLKIFKLQEDKNSK